MKQETLSVSPDGSVSFVWTDDLQELISIGDPVIVRASHVEPTSNGGWQADMSPVGGPMLEPTVLRSDSLSAEREWLRENIGV